MKSIGFWMSELFLLKCGTHQTAGLISPEICEPTFAAFSLHYTGITVIENKGIIKH